MTQAEAVTVAVERMGPRAWVNFEKITEFAGDKGIKVYHAGVIHDDPVDGPVQGVFFTAHSWAELVKTMKSDDGNCARARAAAAPPKRRTP